LTHRLRCSPEPTPDDLREIDDGRDQTLLTVQMGESLDGGPYFDAVHMKGQRRVHFYAAQARQVASVQVSTYAYASAPRAAFRYDLRRRRARVAPPAPFTGAASFEKAPSGDTVWTGDLAVDLLTGPLPLTGPDFRAQLNPPGRFVIIGRQ
jgi:hypothetical protein